MHKAITDELTKDMDASAARHLMQESLHASQAREAEYSSLRDDLANQVVESIMRSIEDAASKGMTQVEFKLKDRSIPPEHRYEVIQTVTSELDQRGFNVLTYWRYWFFNSGTIFQIEW